MNKVWGVIKSHKLVFAVAGVIVLAGVTASAIALTGGNEPAKQQAVSAPKEDSRDTLSDVEQAPVEEVAAPIQQTAPPVQQTASTPSQEPTQPPQPASCAADVEREQAIANENQQYADIVKGVKTAYPSTEDNTQFFKLRDQEKIHQAHLRSIEINYQNKKAELGC